MVVVVFGAVQVRVDVHNTQGKATVRELIVGRTPERLPLSPPTF